MNINLLHLKFFYDAAILESVSGAAKKNFVTQSAISQGISKLEKTLGIEIVTHSRQNFSLTAEGKIVFEQAKHIFKSVYDLQDKINESQGELAGNLHFICTNSLGMSYIADGYLKMKNDFPDVHLKPMLGGLHYIHSWLREGVAEFAVVVDDKEFANYNKLSLKKGQFHLYKHKKAPKNQIENGIFVDNAEGMYVQELFKKYKSQYGKELNIQAELAGWEVVARFTEKNIGLGFFPDYIGSRYSVIEPCSLDMPNFEYEICVIYPKGFKLSRVAMAFIDSLLSCTTH